MEMNWRDAALVVAGMIGIAVAVSHGVLTQRLMVVPFERLSEGRIAAPIRRLVPCLLHFSAFNWFLGGVALIVAAISFGVEARLVTAALVGSSYLYGALGNLWGVRRPHPGWALYAVAIVLIVFGVGGVAR
jgi:hypothetical protein